MEPCFVLLALALLVAPLVLAIVALRTASAQAAAVRRIEGELERLRATIAAPPAAKAAAFAPPVPAPAAARAVPPAPPSPGTAGAAAAGAATPVPAAPRAAAASTERDAAAAPRPPAPPAVPSPPAAAASPPGGSAPPARLAALGHSAWEELLGVRLLLWVGAVALALAGAFLVKLSFERGWISPPVRVALGVAFGVAMLALGERLRRPSARVAQALAAAGVADLFASFLAATNLYHLISPPAGFALLGLTTAVGVGLSLRQGPMVAVVGLAGGLLTPALIHTAHPSARNLFAYLLLLIAGLLAVGRRRRRWWPLAAAAIGGGLLWLLVWLGGPFRPTDAPWLSLFLLAVVAAAFALGGTFAAARPGGDRDRPGAVLAAPGPAPGPPDAAAVALPAVTLAAALLANALVAGLSHYTSGEWVFVGLLAAGALCLAWIDGALEAQAWIALAASAALLGSWGSGLEAEEAPRFLATAGAFAALFGVAGWAGALAGSSGAEGRLWRRIGRGQPPHPGRWAALSGCGALAFFLLAWSATRHVAGVPHTGWGGAALVLALLYLAAAVPVARRRTLRPPLEAALAALAVAVTSFVSLAVPLELERQWFAVAWGLEVTALVWLAGRFRLRALVWLALLLAAVVMVRLAYVADTLSQARGEAPFWNSLLYGYGVPLLCLAAAAAFARRQVAAAAARMDEPPAPGEARRVLGHEAAQLARLLEWGAIGLGFVLASLEVHHAFHPAAPDVEPSGLAEWATLADTWLLLGCALLRAGDWVDRRRRRRAAPPPHPARPPAPGPVPLEWWEKWRDLPSRELAGRMLALLGLAAALLGPGLALDPLWNHQAVGERPVLNLLLWAYAAPALLALWAAAEVRRRGGAWLPRIVGPAALLLTFLLVTLEVRQAFHGAFLNEGEGSAAERYAYSAAWVVLGLALLLAGIARRGKLLRYASLAVMVLAAAKVFVYDTARLADLYRVLSFLGLGVSLLLLAHLYQRFVFREEEER